MTGRWTLLAGLWIAGACTNEADLALVWQPPSLADTATRIDLEVHEDSACAALVQSTTFGPDETPAVFIPAGPACLLARAWNDGCQAYAVGRTTADFPPSGDRIELVLTASAARSCRADEVCRDDRCLRGDAIGPIVQVRAGRHHTCLIYASRDVQCFGFNRGGEVGVAGFSGSIVRPTTFAALFGLERLALGGRVFNEDGAGGFVADVPIQSGFGCAVRDGRAWCFGANEDGQLGRNRADREPYPYPDIAGGLSDVVDIATGGSFACALRADQTVSCWGKNQSGVVGLPPDEAVRSLVPVSFPTLTGVVDLDAGHSHACSVTQEGRLYCWGGNFRNELGVTGVTTTSEPRATPLADVVEVAAGGFHTCARTSEGAVYCWGWRQRGQTGPSTGSSATPTAVIDQNAAEIDAGAKFSCARLTNGEVWCWGENAYGQLGAGVVDERFMANPTPVQVALSTPAVQLSCGSHHCCVLDADARVACWGRGQYGRLGDGDASIHNVGAPRIIDRD